MTMTCTYLDANELFNNFKNIGSILNHYHNYNINLSIQDTK